MTEDVPRAIPRYSLDYRPVMYAIERRVVAAKLPFGQPPRSTLDGQKRVPVNGWSEATQFRNAVGLGMSPLRRE